MVPYWRSSQKFYGTPLIFAQWLKLATSNLARSWGSPRPTIKTTTRGNSGRGLGPGKFPNTWDCPLIFLQRLRCPLIVSGTSCTRSVLLLKLSEMLTLLNELNFIIDSFVSNWLVIDLFSSSAARVFHLLMYLTHWQVCGRDTFDLIIMTMILVVCH